MIWYGVSNKKHYLNAQVHFPVYFPTSDGKIGPIPSFFRRAEESHIQPGQRNQDPRPRWRPFFFGGKSTEKTKHISEKTWFLCVPFFISFFCSCCFFHLFSTVVPDIMYFLS